jgi:hypothetical protein
MGAELSNPPKIVRNPLKMNTHLPRGVAPSSRVRLDRFEREVTSPLRYSTYLLYVVCCMLYVVRCMLYVVCYMLYVICCMLYVVCYMLYVVCCM